MKTVDDFIKHKHGLSNSRIEGANNTSVSSKKTALGDMTEMFIK